MIPHSGNNNVPCPTPPLYSPLLQEAACLVEEAVNAELAARPDARKFAGEYQGWWRAGVAGINRYEGAASGSVARNYRLGQASRLTTTVAITPESAFTPTS